MKLRPNQKTALLEALDDAFNPVTLQQVLISLQKRMSDIVGPNFLFVLQRIVEEAEQEDTLDQLLRAARTVNSTNRRLENITAELEPFLKLENGAITVTAVNQLLDILENSRSPEAAIEDAYRIAAPSTEKFNLEVAHLADRVAARVHWLAIVPGAPGRRPLLVFTAYLLKRTKSRQASKALEDWLDARCRELNEDRKAIDAAAEQTLRRRKGLRAHLVVVISDRNEVNAWSVLVSSNATEWNWKDVLSLAQQRPCEPEELPDLIKDLIGRARTHVKQASNNVVVEVFLPLALLTSEIDQWRIAYGRQQELEIGSAYPVLLRSYDRTYDQDLWQVREEWRDHWERHRTLAERHQAKVVDADLLKQKNYRAVSQSQQICCAALNFVPDEKDTLERLIFSGTPVAVWLRSGPPPAQQNELQMLYTSLTSVPTPDWKDKILKTRLDASSAAANHFGRHLALMWDDADKLPIDAEDVQVFEDIQTE